MFYAQCTFTLHFTSYNDEMVRSRELLCGEQGCKHLNICCCFPRRMIRELHLKWSTPDLSQCLDAGCWPLRQLLHLLGYNSVLIMIGTSRLVFTHLASFYFIFFSANCTFSLFSHIFSVLFFI